MRRHSQSGKVKMSSVLIVAIIIYAGFYLFKIITANLTPGQIKNDITNAIGIERGPAFTIAKGEKIVRDVLKRHGVLESEYDDEEEDVEMENVDPGPDAVGEPQRIVVEFNAKSVTVKFYTNFHLEVDFLLYKEIKYYEVSGEVQNYN